MRKEKQLLLDQIRKKIGSSTAFVVTKYEHLNPDVSAGFRTQLAAVGASFFIAKKRIFLKAALQEKVSFDEEMLKGHIGVMFAHQDPVSATKTLFDFISANKQQVEVVAGQFEGKICSAQDVKLISQLPSQDGMRSQFLATLEAPLSQTLAVMEALLTSVAHCLENKSSQSSE